MSNELTEAERAANTDLVRLIGSLVGKNLPNECPWVLPSGKVITAAEMRHRITNDNP
jgi:hypothetical protein